MNLCSTFFLTLGISGILVTFGSFCIEVHGAMPTSKFTQRESLISRRFDEQQCEGKVCVYFNGTLKDGIQKLDSLPGISVNCQKEVLIVCLSNLTGGPNLSDLKSRFESKALVFGSADLGCKDSDGARHSISFETSRVFGVSSGENCLQLEGKYISGLEIFEEINVVAKSNGDQEKSNLTETGSGRRDFAPIDGSVANQAFDFSATIFDSRLFDGMVNILATLSSPIAFSWELSALTKQCPYPYLYCPATTHCCGYFQKCCKTSWYGGCKRHCTYCSGQCADACYWLTAFPGNPCGTIITRNKMSIGHSGTFKFNISVKSLASPSRMETAQIPRQTLLTMPISTNGISFDIRLLLSGDLEAHAVGDRTLDSFDTSFDMHVSKNTEVEYRSDEYTLIMQDQPIKFQDTLARDPAGPTSTSNISFLIQPTLEFSIENGRFFWEKTYEQKISLKTGYDLLLNILTKSGTLLGPAEPLASTKEPQVCHASHRTETSVECGLKQSELSMTSSGDLQTSTWSLPPNSAPVTVATVFLDCGEGVCPAQPGFFCQPGTFLPQQCPAGSYCIGGQNPALKCTLGSYCPPGSASDADCPAGFYCPNMSSLLECAPSSFCANRSTTKTICLAGFYCSSPSLQVPCAAGYYCAPGSTKPTSCEADGHYCVARSSAQVLCLPGFSCSSPKEQTSCPAGHFSAAGATACTPCPVTSYCPEVCMTVPTICEIGTYCPTFGMSSPIECPDGANCLSAGMSAPTPGARPSGYFPSYPSGFKVTDTIFDLGLDAWVITVFGTRSSPDSNIAFVLPRSQTELNGEYSANFSRTFDFSNFPCRSADTSVLSGAATTCCLTELNSLYHVSATFSIPVSASLQCSYLKPPQLTKTTLAFPEYFRGMPGTRIVQLPLEQEHSPGSFHAKIYISRTDMRDLASRFSGSEEVYEQFDFFIVFAEFYQVPGSSVLDSVSQQVRIPLTRSGYFTVFISGGVDTTFLNYIRVTANEVIDNIDSTKMSQYITVAFGLKDNYSADPITGLVPAQSIQVGTSIGDSSATVVWSNPCMQQLSQEYMSRLSQPGCGPNVTMCLPYLKERYVFLNIPLDEDSFSSLYNAVVSIKFVISVIDASGWATSTLLSALLPITKNSVWSSCVVQPLISTGLDYLDKVMFMAGTAGTQQGVEQLEAVEIPVGNPNVQLNITQLRKSHSAESGMLTMALFGKQGYVLEVENVKTIHITGDSAHSDQIMAVISSPGGAFRILLDRATNKSSLSPSAELSSLCSSSGAGLSVGRWCIFRDVIQGRSTIPVLSHEFFPGQEARASQFLLRATGAGSNTFIADVGANFSRILTDRHQLGNKTRRAFWINPVITWVSSGANGTDRFSLSQQVVVCALVRVYSSGGQVSRVLLSGATASGLPAAASVGMAALEFNVSLSSVIAAQLSQSEHLVSVWRAVLLLTQNEVCMLHSSLEAVVQERFRRYLQDKPGAARAFSKVLVTSSAIDMTGIDCMQHERRSATFSPRIVVKPKLSGEFTVVIIFKDGSEQPSINLELLRQMPGILSIDQISVPTSILVSGFEPADKPTANASAINIAVPASVAASLTAMGLVAVFFFRRRLTLAWHSFSTSGAEALFKMELSSRGVDRDSARCKP